LKAKTRFYKLKEGKYALYIPVELHSDSQWPFKDMEADVEIVIMPSKIEDLGKLLVRQTLETQPRNKPLERR